MRGIAVACALAFGFAALTAQADTVIVESDAPGGDFKGSIADPSDLGTIAAGTTSITGAVSGGDNTQVLTTDTGGSATLSFIDDDAIAFTIAPGTTLSGWQVSASIPGPVGGTEVLTASISFGLGLLHVEADGQNLDDPFVADLVPGQSASVSEGPLGPGTYVMRLSVNEGIVFAASSDDSGGPGFAIDTATVLAYDIRLDVVPEPTGVFEVALLAGALVLARRRVRA